MFDRISIIAFWIAWTQIVFGLTLRLLTRPHEVYILSGLETRQLFSQTADGKVLAYRL
jgi:hypothetical protein